MSFVQSKRLSNKRSWLVTRRTRRIKKKRTTHIKAARRIDHFRAMSSGYMGYVSIPSSARKKIPTPRWDSSGFFSLNLAIVSYLRVVLSAKRVFSKGLLYQNILCLPKESNKAAFPIGNAALFVEQPFSVITLFYFLLRRPNSTIAKAVAAALNQAAVATRLFSALWPVFGNSPGITAF